jgi:hypothetical protein
MSGAKVVRIVTREEIIARCQGEIARLEETVREWVRVCKRKDLAAVGEIKAVEKRRVEIHYLLRADRFADVQREVQREIAFLRHDLQTRVEQAAEAAAKARAAGRRLANAAATLITSLSDAGIDVPPNVLATLHAARNDAANGVEEAERAVASTFSLLVPEVPPGHLSERQRELALKLGEGEATATLADWLAGAPAADDEVSERLDRYIAEFEAEAGRDAALPFVRRAAAIATEPSAAHRKILADSVIIELAAVARRARERSELLQTLAGLAAELGAFDSQAAAKVSTRMEQARHDTNLQAVRTLIDEIRSTLETRRRHLAANSRREAVLRALSGLGYEIREGMMTAWVESGRLTLHKAASDEYGLELAGSPDAGRVQFRTVAFGSPANPRDSARDLDAETRWCAEFEDVKARVARGGNEIIIEKATSAGEVPLKVVEPAAREDREDVQARTVKTQTIS